jgi:glutamine---fructose-6-phosphate transaminase (isomerizing)
MAAETAEIPAVLARLRDRNGPLLGRLGRRLRELDPPLVILCGRGSSGHACMFGRHLLETRLGLPTVDMVPSTISLYGARLRLRGALWLGVSQSGRSPDILACADQAREAGALTVALVNDPGSPLARSVETVLPLEAGPERSVAATKSFAASLVGLIALAAAWTGEPRLRSVLDRLPELADAAMELDWSAGLPVLTPADRAVVLGRGPGLALAYEAALKLQETSGLFAVGYSTAEFRHGPMGALAPGMPILGFVQEDASAASIRELHRELAARGAVLLAADAIETPGLIGLRLPKGLDPLAAPLVAVTAFYLMAERLARERGRDPDSPPHLAKVTRTI